jgi:CrcB protein
VNWTPLYHAFLVGCGGFVGSVLRYVLSGAVQRLDPVGTFPYGTLAVNAVGCLVIGVLGGLADSRHLFGPELRHLIFLGVLGGLTTFSTFGHETLALMRDGEHLKAGANVIASIVVCLVLAWLGYEFGRTR